MSLEMFRLDGKVAVVTGGSKGFGKAIALGLADAGADVVVASRTQADLDKVAEAIETKGGKALAVATDTTKLESIKSKNRRLTWRVCHPIRCGIDGSCWPCYGFYTILLASSHAQ